MNYRGGKVVQDDIIRLSHDNPTIAAALHLWKRNDCTFEEAMMVAVVCLAEHNAELIKRLTRAYAEGVPIVVDGETAKKWRENALPVSTWAEPWLAIRRRELAEEAK